MKQTATPISRIAVTALLSFALAAAGLTATAEAAPPQSTTASEANSSATEFEPELFGIPIRDWCTYTVMDSKAPVYDESNTRATRTGTLYRGDEIIAQCDSKDLWEGGRYTGSCGDTSTWLLYTSNSGTRYVPWSCFSG